MKAEKKSAPASGRRIAIVGNMNNNGFSLLRYFTDLGQDAHLYSFNNDHLEGSHFHFTSDTWYPEHWADRVTMLPIRNDSHSLYPPRFTLRGRRILRRIREIADGHSAVVGSGVAPALFAKAGRRLTAFFPYATGVELVGHLPFLTAMRSTRWRRLAYGYVRGLQVRGILKAEHCFNSEMSLTADVLRGIGRDFDRMPAPIVYPESPPADPPREVAARAEGLRQHSFVVFSHARQLWVPDPSLSASAFRSFSKNSDWLIRGFAAFVKRRRRIDAVLALVEYGPDVDQSKRLIRELGVEDRVIWLPKMQRREILYLLRFVDVGVGEFHADPGIIWGGTGWEILASGRPLIQAFNFTPEGFEAEFGYPPPPLIHAGSPGDVEQAIERLYDDRDQSASIGQASERWFNTHNGIGLARRWLDKMQEGRAA